MTVTNSLNGGGLPSRFQSPAAASPNIGYSSNAGLRKPGPPPPPGIPLPTIAKPSQGVYRWGLPIFKSEHMYSSFSHFSSPQQAQHPERGSDRTKEAQGLQDHSGEAVEDSPAPEVAQSAAAAATTEAEPAPPRSPRFRGHAQRQTAAGRSAGKEASAAPASAPEKSGSEAEKNGECFHESTWLLVLLLRMPQRKWRKTKQQVT